MPPPSLLLAPPPTALAPWRHPCNAGRPATQAHTEQRAERVNPDHPDEQLPFSEASSCGGASSSASCAYELRSYVAFVSCRRAPVLGHPPSIVQRSP